MAEYIEREKAIDYLMEIIDRPNHPEWLWTDEICGSLNTIPAADVRPVVFCKDCKHAHMTYDGLCKYCDMMDERGVDDALYLPGDWFCAYGEKREER